MDSFQREIEWVLEPMKGIEEDPNRDSAFVVPIKGREGGFTTHPPVKTGTVDPPSYIVGLLFRAVAGFTWITGDKSAWEVRVIYEGERFRIWDRRHSSWSFGPIDNAEPNGKTTSALFRKITQATKRLDSMLETNLKDKVDIGDFYLINSHRHLRGIFEYFKDEVQRTLRELEVLRNSPIPSIEDDPELQVTKLSTGGTVSQSPLLDNHYNSMLRLEEAVSHNSIAALGFYFSFLEMLLDALFAFLPDRSIHYLEFQELAWDERFKTVLPVSTDRELRDIYEKDLRRLRNRIRNPMFHALGGRPGLLVPYGPLGLIPTSYEVLTDSVHYSWQPVKIEESKEILRVYAAFEGWIETNDNVWYIRRFLEWGFEIPFEPVRVKEIRSWMTSRDAFEAALEEEAERLDYLSEQY